MRRDVGSRFGTAVEVQTVHVQLFSHFGQLFEMCEAKVVVFGSLMLIVVSKRMLLSSFRSCDLIKARVS